MKRTRYRAASTTMSTTSWSTSASNHQARVATDSCGQDVATCDVRGAPRCLTWGSWWQGTGCRSEREVATTPQQATRWSCSVAAIASAPPTASKGSGSPTGWTRTLPCCCTSASKAARNCPKTVQGDEIMRTATGFCFDMCTLLVRTSGELPHRLACTLWEHCAGGHGKCVDSFSTGETEHQRPRSLQVRWPHVGLSLCNCMLSHSCSLGQLRACFSDSVV